MDTQDHLTKEAAFLLDRLADFEREHVNGLDGEREEAYRQWAGHVVPSIERMQMILRSMGTDKDAST